MTAPLQSLNWNDDYDEHVQHQEYPGKSHDCIANFLTHINTLHQIVQKHEVVHDEHKNAFVEDF